MSFRETFYRAFYSEPPDYETMYAMLNQDMDATMINYPRVGVDYIIRALSLDNMTLTQIFILRTTHKQHEAVIQMVGEKEQGFFLECKRLLVDNVHLNRGVITFFRYFHVDPRDALEEFFKLPIERRVINVNHAMGFLDPPEAFRNMHVTIETGMSAESKPLSHGHDIVNFKRVKLAYQKKLCSLQNILVLTRDIEFLEACGFKVFDKKDAFKLFY